MPTIETCFDCFETSTSDAKKIRRRHKDPRNSKCTQIFSTPPPPLAGGKGRASKMAQVPEGGNFAILSPKLIVNKTAELFH